MNNTRIRYSKVSQGVLKSRRHFVTSTGVEATVELNLATKQYRIVDAVSGFELASGGNTTNLSVLKIQAKKGLVELGVEFADEVRNRGNVETQTVGQ